MNRKSKKTVRQNVISYLTKNLHVPKKLIRVEVPLKNYGVDSSACADIIIYTPAGYALAVIECESPEVFIDEKSLEKIYNYAAALNCDYFSLTNDAENFVAYAYDEKQDDYVPIETLPQYSKMLQGKFSPLQIEEPPPRIELEELEKKYQIYVDEWTIGENTPKYFAVPLANFFECLMDLDHIFPAGQYKIFKLIGDMGIRILNVGGGKFRDYYRAFEVEYNGVTKIVSISVANYGNGKTSINVAIDREKDIHNSLECVVEDNFQLIGNRLKIFHHGRITKGHGALKIDGLRKLIAENYPQIIEGKRFYLGTLTHNRLWNLDDAEIITVIENLVSYALIRDDYREICN